MRTNTNTMTTYKFYSEGKQITKGDDFYLCIPHMRDGKIYMHLDVYFEVQEVGHDFIELVTLVPPFSCGFIGGVVRFDSSGKCPFYVNGSLVYTAKIPYFTAKISAEI